MKRRESVFCLSKERYKSIRNLLLIAILTVIGIGSVLVTIILLVVRHTGGVQ